jgi:hypothetical protein
VTDVPTNLMTLKDLHDWLGKLLEGGADPDTICARYSEGAGGWQLARPADFPELGPAWLANETQWGEPREVWYFRDEVCAGETEPDCGEGVEPEKRTVLYL